MDATSSQDWTQVIHKAIDRRHQDVASLNKFIHENPELAYEEFKAHDAFVSTLTNLGFETVSHAYGVKTAFSAEYGSGGRLVVFNSEYDALPGIGHACGHNLIASAGLASFLGVAAAIKESGLPGRVRLLGTPAEEGGGGKLPLIQGGAYENAAACMMVHPGPQYLLPGNISGVAAIKMLANIKWRISFHGQPAHAAMEPWNGLNALDAMCLAYNGVSMLRQQMRPHERVHGVFWKGGDRPNIIPAETSLDYYVRSDTLAAAERLWQRVKNCFEAGALATGCRVSYEPINSYADLRSSIPLCQEFCNVMPTGSVNLDYPSDVLAGSTDMGNVTYECPGFHGAFGIDTDQGHGNHTAGFATAAGLERSLETTIEWAKGMAVVAWRLLCDEAFAAEVYDNWRKDMEVAAQ